MQLEKHRLSLENIIASVDLIDQLFLNTPQFINPGLSQIFGLNLTVKIETINPIRCFKGRGSEVLVSKSKGYNHLICASAGNFGQAMAFSCKKRGIEVTVHASTSVNPFKLEMMRSLGANVELSGKDFDEAKSKGRKQAKRINARFVEDTMDIETIEGAGTLGLELLKLPYELDVLLIALGDGAMLTGISRVMKAYSPNTQVVAIQSEGAPAFIESIRKNQYVSYDTTNTIADGIAVRLPMKQSIKDLELLVDDTFLVKEKSIKKGMKLIHRHVGIVAEPSAAVGIAALLENNNLYKGKNVATIICGSNTTLRK
ncbi:pyridoxal-phosphate dependent enzyme [Algoriphagus sp. C2-6-M1]|uniref:threonine ammonia-lyase n=1 Tax=Algoriphagus persicinus TaxID=3108754 RepID=UPI002B3C881E|nr:pyridoxal-phosphate dependent enzyme [Algoriphagus sp. C2-6-M1]MEB2781485.1 pyridoxal-phosphate dependent enzyme [Algoriphagus sp. C2-6-M1]